MAKQDRAKYEAMACKLADQVNIDYIMYYFSCQFMLN